MILATAYNIEELAQQAEEAGINGFLQKPANPSSLSDVIMEAFGKGTSGGPRRGREDTVEGLDQIQGARILVAEDNEINQQVAQEILEGSGFVVEIAEDGQVALDMVQASEYDVILMDINMPNMDGLEATKRIRELEKDPQSSIPIVAMTASAMTQDIELTQEAGMDDHVAKPVDVKQLLSTLVKWIKPGVREQGLEGEGPKAEGRRHKGEVPLKTGSTLRSDRKSEGQGIRQKEEGKREGTEHAILPDALPGINIEKGLKTVIGNEKLYRKLLSQFHESSGNAVADIRESLDADDLETAARMAHTVKGVAGNLGAEALFPAAADLELAIKRKEMDGLNGLIESFETQLYIVMSGIQELEDRDAAAKQADAPIGEVTIDIEAVTPLLIEMAGLLESDLMEAMNRLEALEQHFANSVVAEEFSRLENAVNGFDTDQAATSLEEMAKKLSIAL
jgi:two-component system sensor histidine kinase/response regulator